MFPNLSSPLYEGASLVIQMWPGAYLPFEYEGALVEAASSKTSAWIGANLLMSPIYDIKGKDAVEFLNSVCINEFSTLKENGVRHAVICNQKGQIMTDGVVIKLSENHFRSYWLNPPLEHLVKSSKLDVQGEDFSFKEYFIQIDGERSLEILERACGHDLHDIGFARHRLTKIGDKDMRVLRLSMSGRLGYEVHGPAEDFDEVYSKIAEAGKALGARKLGMHSYSGPNHTPGGLPNIHIHYPLPWFESDDLGFPGLSAHLRQRPDIAMFNMVRELQGSVGDDLNVRFVTPFDVGWDHLVNLKKKSDFIGREALAALADQPPRALATLVWNADDVGAVFASQLKGVESEVCEPIERLVDVFHQHFVLNAGRPDKGYIYRADKVLHLGRQVGISAGRVIDHASHRMLSLAFVEPELAAEGTELKVLWGTPGTAQMEVRAVVSRTPFQDGVLNSVRDVSDVPRLQQS
jgi:glycine cleavage system aminomethyltransferase T